jgi:hypothetical protein
MKIVARKGHRTLREIDVVPQTCFSSALQQAKQSRAFGRSGLASNDHNEALVRVPSSQLKKGVAITGEQDAIALTRELEHLNIGRARRRTSRSSDTSWPSSFRR